MFKNLFLTTIFTLLLVKSFAQSPANSFYTIGTKWIYETQTVFNPIIISYRTYEIVDTSTINGTLTYVIERNPGLFGTKYMYQEEGKVYFWDNQSEQFQLNFDFENDQAYDVPWTGMSSEMQEIAHVNIDSITQWQNNTDTIDVQHLRIENNGTLGSDLFTNVYKNIGSDSGLKLDLGCGLCDPTVRVTKLRCFENDSVQYNFVGYPCDSTFLMTSTQNIRVGELQLSPNPTRGFFQINGLNAPGAEYQIFNMNGQLVQEGIFSKPSIIIERTGVYVLKIRQGSFWYVEKVVVGS